MNLLFISPPMDYNAIKKEYSFEAYMPPLGLLYLAAPLEKKGHKIKVIDFIAELYSEQKLNDDVS